MRSIYASASKTILWLGEEEHDHAEGLAISFLQTLCERARTAQKSEYGEVQDAFSRFIQIMKEQNPELDLPNDTPTHASNRSLVFNESLIKQQSEWLFGEVKNGKYKEELAAIATMYQMPWWTRCWMFQEAIVSKTADLLYGSSVIDFEAVRVANGILTLVHRSLFNSVSLHEEGFQNLLQMSQLNRINKLVELEEKWKTRSNLRIREVLNVSRQNDSTDPKDRIYAMLGLMDPTYNIKPNYTPSYTTAQVFITAAKASIQHDGILDILADGHEINRNKSLGLPSWVPDFSTALGHLPMCKWEIGDGKSMFDASLHTFFDEGPLFSGVPPPQFLPDEYGRVDRVLRCAMLNLGPVAHKHSIDDCSNKSGSLETVILHYFETLAAAGLKDVYTSTITENTDAVPNVPLVRALIQTLGCGIAPGDTAAGDRDVSFGNLELKTTTFMSQVGEVLIGIWRFFVTPSKIMGIAPAAAE